MSRANRPYTGPMGLLVKDLCRPGKSRLEEWFSAGSRVCLTHKGRTALFLACRVLDVKPGEQIIAPAYNCGSEVDPLLHAGAEVVLYRVDRTLRFDLDEIEDLVRPGVRAVCVTHYFGFPQPVQEVHGLCQRRGISLIEDCAHALWSTGPEGPVGATGDLAIYSFPKTLPVPDGGALVINNRSLATPMALSTVSPLRAARGLSQHLVHGWIRRGRLMGSAARFADAARERLRGRACTSAEPERFPDISVSRYYRPTRDGHTISGVSRRLLSHFDRGGIVKARRRNYLVLQDLLRGAEGIRPVFDGLPPGTCPLAFPIMVHDRQGTYEGLRLASISAYAFWASYHRDLPWEEFEDACFLKDHVLALPIHQDLSERSIEHIVRSVRDLVKRRRR